MTERLLHLAAESVWQGAALTAAGAAAAAFLGRRRAADRILLWRCVLVLMLVMPLVPRSGGYRTPAGDVVADSPRVQPTPVQRTDPGVTRDAPLVGAAEASERAPVTVRVSGGTASALLGAYVLGVVLLLLRLSMDLAGIRRLKRRARPLGGERLALLRALQERCGVRRRVAFAESPDVAGPALVGFLRPALLLPQGAQPLDGRALEQIGAHELAHLHRGDDWLMLLDRVLAALFFFNPAVHFICGRLALEREIACDEWALQRSGATPVQYSETLLQAARAALTRRGIRLAAGMAQRSLTRRIRHLHALDSGSVRRRRPAAIAAVATILAAAGSLHALPPMTVVLEDAVVSRAVQALEEEPVHPLATGTARGAEGLLLDSAFTRLEQDGYRGAVLVARHGVVLLERGFGAADPATGRAILPGTAFNVGAMAKTMTAAAILQLEAEGKLSVSDPLTRWLGPLPAPRDRITLHHLLTHTSGITSRQQPVFASSRDAFIAGIRDSPADFEPGTRQRFTDVGYSALAAVIELASGLTYEEYVRTRFLEPLAMAQTWFDGEAPRADAALELAATGDPASAVAPRRYDWGRRGGMGLNATVGDLFRWQQALDGGFFPDPIRRRMLGFARFDPEFDFLTGYGWLSSRSDQGRMVHHALSGWPGNSVELAWEPASGTTVVLVIDNRVDWEAPRHSAILAMLHGAPLDAAYPRLRRQIGEW